MKKVITGAYITKKSPYLTWRKDGNKLGFKAEQKIIKKIKEQAEGLDKNKQNILFGLITTTSKRKIFEYKTLEEVFKKIAGE